MQIEEKRTILPSYIKGTWQLYSDLSMSVVQLVCFNSNFSSLPLFMVHWACKSYLTIKPLYSNDIPRGLKAPSNSLREGVVYGHCTSLILDNGLLIISQHLKSFCTWLFATLGFQTYKLESGQLHI